MDISLCISIAFIVVICHVYHKQFLHAINHKQTQAQDKDANYLMKCFNELCCHNYNNKLNNETTDILGAIRSLQTISLVTKTHQ